MVIKSLSLKRFASIFSNIGLVSIILFPSLIIPYSISFFIFHISWRLFLLSDVFRVISLLCICRYESYIYILPFFIDLLRKRVNKTCRIVLSSISIIIPIMLFFYDTNMTKLSGYIFIIERLIIGILSVLL